MSGDVNNTYFISSGEGEPLILIHGVGLDHTMWKEQLDYFSLYYKVYAYDMLGHGQSEKPLKQFYSLTDFTNQLKSLMDKLHIDRAHLVGFSMGAMVAQAFGLTFSDRVRTLTFANAVANRNETERKSVRSRVNLVEQKGKNATIETAVERWFSKDFTFHHTSIVQSIKQRLETNDEKAYLNAYRLFATADKELWEQLDQIKAPTFVITGEYDIGSNPRMAKDMSDKISGAEVCVIPDVRHMLPIEKADEFNKNVHHFLKKYKEVKNN